MFITGLGTAVPVKFTQAECWEAAKDKPQILGLSSRAQRIFKSVLLSEDSIATRHFAVHSLDEIFEPGPDVLQARFSNHAPALAVEAAIRALADGDVTAAEIDAVVVS